jgi:hypothetical protein
MTKDSQRQARSYQRLANSIGSDIRPLAWAMLMKGARRLWDLERRMQTYPRTILGGNYVDEIMRYL